MNRISKAIADLQGSCDLKLEEGTMRAKSGHFFGITRDNLPSPKRSLGFAQAGQTCREPDQLGTPVRRRQTTFDQIGKRLARAHRPGHSLRHGVPPCWRRRLPAQVSQSSARMHPYQIFQQVSDFTILFCYAEKNMLEREMISL